MAAPHLRPPPAGHTFLAVLGRRRRPHQRPAFLLQMVDVGEPRPQHAHPFRRCLRSHRSFPPCAPALATLAALFHRHLDRRRHLPPTRRRRPLLRPRRLAPRPRPLAPPHRHEPRVLVFLLPQRAGKRWH